MNDFDELLDGVLREDVSAQPRAGLEGRVMARVRADGQRRPVERFVIWGAIAAALPVCVVALLVWPKSVPPKQRVVETPAVAASASPEKVATEPVQHEKSKVMQERVSARQKSALVTHAAQSLPKLQIAAIEITPLTIKPIGEMPEGFTKQARKVKANEDVSWSVVLVCDGDGGVGGSAGTGGKAGVECGRSVIRYTVLSADAGAEIYGERGWATSSRAAEHHD